MKLSVLIVSYNVKHYLRQCLDSVWRSATEAGIDVEVFVVDNRSKDSSVAWIREAFPEHCAGHLPHARLHLIANHRNVGFGRANNQALRQSKGDYILFLNPDTILTERTLTDCLRAAEQTPRLGAMGVRMLKSDGSFALESRRGLPTPWTAFCKMSGLARIFPRSRTFGRYYLRFLNEEDVTPIEIVSGAFMLCARKALDTCGGFDEEFFMYGEDIDLSYRLLKAGFQNIYVPTPILHYKGESTQKNSFRYVHVFYQAMLIFFRKHFPTTSIALTIPVHLAIYAQAIATLIRQNGIALAHYLYPRHYRRPLRVHYVGAASTHAAFEEQSERWGLTPTCSTTVPEQTDATILAFSTKDFTYQQMLDTLACSNHRTHIGTYFPDQCTLIIGSEVYC